jgi:hypothetical protein
MNIKVDRSMFLSELHYLQGVAGTKQIIPALSHLLLETGHRQNHDARHRPRSDDHDRMRMSRSFL